MSDVNLIHEFVTRYAQLDAEAAAITESKKELREEFQALGLPVKSINAAIAIVKQYRKSAVPRALFETYIAEVEKVL